MKNQGLSFLISLSNILAKKNTLGLFIYDVGKFFHVCVSTVFQVSSFLHVIVRSLWQLFLLLMSCMDDSDSFENHFITQNLEIYLLSILDRSKEFIYCTDTYIPGSPREARQPSLGPWLDFEKYKTAAAVAAHWWSVRHYGFLASQKYTVAALHTAGGIQAFLDFSCQCGDT